MGLYLGTNELGGGGGGGIGKTVTVGDFNYINAIPLSRWTELGFYYYISYYPRMVMFQPSSDFTTTYTYTATSGADTYQTIANITGASNGGALHNAQAANSSITGGGTWTFKITIDGGTPVEISTIGMSNRQYTGFILGPHNYSAHGYHSSVSTAFNGGIGESPILANVYSNSYPAGGTTSASASYIPYYQSSSSSGATTIYGVIKGYRAPLALSYGMPFVHFTSSCKVEFKSSSTNFYSNTIQTAAEISTF